MSLLIEPLYRLLYLAPPITPHLSTTIIKKGVEVQIFDVDNYDKDLTMQNLFDDKGEQREIGFIK